MELGFFKTLFFSNKFPSSITLICSLNTYCCPERKQVKDS